MASQNTKIWTILELLKWSEGYFQSLDIDAPRLTAEILLCRSLGIRRIDLYLQHDRPMSGEELAAYKVLIQRRASREPVAYITGSKGFWEFEFKVNPNVLIPRPDTETLVSSAIQIISSKNKAKSRLKILELGTGSGAVIVSIAASDRDNLFYATDISFGALEVAKNNERAVTGYERVCFVSGDWFSFIKSSARFDLIISNPPYIPTDDIKSLQPEIHGFEPVSALDGGMDGLDCIRHIICRALEFLVPGGTLLMEIGCDQQKGVQGTAAFFPQYENPRFIKDDAGHDRVVCLEKKIDNQIIF